MKVILSEDALLAKARILKIEKLIFELGEEFNEAVNQSSETWHDNAPFDVVRDKQTLLSSERSQLIEVLKTHQLASVPRSARICKIGTFVKLSHLDGPVFIAGHITMRDLVKGIRVMSCVTPLSQVIAGKKVGDEIIFGGKSFTIESVSVSR